MFNKGTYFIIIYTFIFKTTVGSILNHLELIIKFLNY